MKYSTLIQTMLLLVLMLMATSCDFSAESGKKTSVETEETATVEVATEKIKIKPAEPESTPQVKVETKSKPQANAEPRIIAVSGDEYSFSPSSITVNKGEKVKVVFTNVGQNRHNWVIGGLNLSTRAIGSNETDTLEFTADATGSYEIFCSIAGHKEAGMVGSLTVK